MELLKLPFVYFTGSKVRVVSILVPAGEAFPSTIGTQSSRPSPGQISAGV